MLTDTENITIIAPRPNSTLPPQESESSQNPPHDPTDPLQKQAPDPPQDGPDPPQEHALGPPSHEFIQLNTITKASDLKMYVIKTIDNEKIYYRCNYPDCSDEDHFRKARQAISHIRRVHVREKPFRCTTWYAYL